MDIQNLKSFFMWCTIINGILLVLGIVGTFMIGPDLRSSLHSQWANIPVETVNSVVYLLLGVMKVFWLFFNFAPYLALVIIGKK